MSSFLWVFTVFMSLILFGCAGNQKESTPVQQAPQPPPPTSIKTYECPNGDVVTSLSSCPKCPASCDDNNSCTFDACNSTTKFVCIHTDTDNASCGENKICENGICKERTLTVPMNTTVETNASNITGEMECVPNDSICEESCSADIDSCLKSCDAEQMRCLKNCSWSTIFEPKGTCDKCVYTGCDVGCKQKFDDSGDCKYAKCDILKKDGFCPSNCSALTDLDCPLYNVGQPGKSRDGNITLRVLIFSCRRSQPRPTTGIDSNLVVNYKVCYNGTGSLILDNSMFLYCQYNDVNCKWDPYATYQAIENGTCLTNDAYFDRCSPAGRFVFDPGHLNRTVVFKVQSE